VTFEEYTNLALRTARSDYDRRSLLLNWTLGICGEAGEFADSVKKFEFHGHTTDKEELKDELGDVLWYVAMLCEVLGFSMEQVALDNVRKLKNRYPKGFDPERSINRRVENENKPDKSTESS